ARKTTYATTTTEPMAIHAARRGVGRRSRSGNDGQPATASTPAPPVTIITPRAPAATPGHATAAIAAPTSSTNHGRSRSQSTTRCIGGADTTPDPPVDCRTLPTRSYAFDHPVVKPATIGWPGCP